MTAPPLVWLTLTTEELGRWTWQHRLRWPVPLAASAVGQWQPPLEELLAEAATTPDGRSRAEERLLATLAEILADPAYCAYVIRAEGGRESYVAAVVRGDDAVAVVDAPGEVRLARVSPTLIAATLAGQLPKLLPAPTVRVELPAQTAALLASGFARNAPEQTLRSALDSAGIPEAVAARLFAGAEAVRATGTVGAMRYAAAGATISARCASWTEMSDGGMIAYDGRAGDVVWEPLSAAAVARAVADALTGLGS